MLYALVFGHAVLIKERTKKAIEIYKQGRAKKIVFMGGGYGDSNASNLVEAQDINHDRNNWYLNDNVWDNNGKHGSGKTLVENEAKLLIEGAQTGILETLKYKKKNSTQ